MGSYSWLHVNGHTFYGVRDDFDGTILGLFLDSDVQRSVESYDRPGFEPDISLWYESTSRIIGSRLDALGFTISRANEVVSQLQGQEDELEHLRRWIAKFATPYPSDDLEAQLRYHEDDLLYEDVPEVALDLDSRLLLRKVLESAGPETDAVFDLSEVTRFFPEMQHDPLPPLCHQHFARHYTEDPSYGPLVVVTEGSTDAEFLSAGLELLRPHLTDCVRFLDYGHKPAGGAAEAIKALKAFASAGIRNRIVGVLDNDTGACEALTSVDAAGLPENIRIVQLPNLELLSDYPSIGPEGETSSDINGLAASVEFYFDRDVLLNGDGTLSPVQWMGYSKATGTYQGELIDKRQVQEAIRASIAKHRKGSSRPNWPSMQLALDAILTAWI